MSIIFVGANQLKKKSRSKTGGRDISIVENVPAGVCENCGEQYFDAKTARAQECKCGGYMG
jgi:YgiT-type zinc finger domain-containing protein